MGKIPVYVVNGFLDAGKTTYVCGRIATDRFYKKGRTLVVACEEGEQPYDCSLMTAGNAQVLYIEDAHGAAEALRERILAYEPGRIFVENNAMKPFDLNALPPEAEVVSCVTLVDGSTLALYFNNMKQTFADMIRPSELVIFNRTGERGELASYAHGFRLMNQKAGFLWESPLGYHEKAFEDAPPYDVQTDPITVEADQYSFWYLDAVSHPQRYEGKRIRVAVQAGRSGDEAGEAGETFFAGRQVMTCCLNDLQFLGFDCFYEKAAELAERAWISLLAKAEVTRTGPYGIERLVLRAEEVKLIPPLQKPVAE